MEDSNYEDFYTFAKEMWNAPLTEAMSSQLKILEAMGDEDIDCSDIPVITEEEWDDPKVGRFWVQLFRRESPREYHWDLRGISKNG